MLKTLSFSFLLVVGSTVFGQTIIIQEEFSAGLPFGWQVIDADGHTPHASLSQFNAGYIWNISSDDTAMASTSYFADTTAPAEDYLILPKISVPTFSKLSWEARSVDASYPDQYYVLISTTDSLPSSFTDTLMNVTEEYFLWNRKSIMLDTMGYANTDVFIAFRNYSSNGYILEIDDIWVEGSDNASLPKNEFTFQIYPNPTEQFLTIQLNEVFTADIFSIAGQRLLTSTDKKVDVSFLEPGTYFISVNTPTGKAVKPFVKH
jgi:hypothetical protein